MHSFLNRNRKEFLFYIKAMKSIKKTTLSGYKKKKQSKIVIKNHKKKHCKASQPKKITQQSTTPQC